MIHNIRVRYNFSIKNRKMMLFYFFLSPLPKLNFESKAKRTRTIHFL